MSTTKAPNHTITRSTENQGRRAWTRTTRSRRASMGLASKQQRSPQTRLSRPGITRLQAPAAERWQRSTGARRSPTPHLTTAPA